jgi:hypothetical protein
VDGRANPVCGKFGELGCGNGPLIQSKIVITGLDPVIHDATAPIWAA